MQIVNWGGKVEWIQRRKVKSRVGFVTHPVPFSKPNQARHASPVLANLLKSTMLRVLVAHNIPATRTGGMSRLQGFIHDRVEAAGHQVDYFTAENVPRWSTGRLGRFAFPWLLWRHAVAAAKANRPYDIVNVHEPSGAALVIGKAAAGSPKVVATSYGVERRSWSLSLEEARLGRSTVSWKSRIGFPLTSLWQSGLTLRRADHIVCSNLQDREYLQDWLGLPPDRITRMFSAGSAAYASNAVHRTYADGKRLVFFGTWIKRKGTSDFVEAFRVLADRNPQLELLVLGGGRPQSEIFADFSESLRARVSSSPATHENDLAPLLAGCDIYVLPSLFEGTPLTLIEAMMSGLPIVTTDTCGMRDVIQHERNGLLVPIRSPGAIAAAVQRLVDDPALRRRLGQQAHADATQLYTWDCVSQPICDLYERICRS